MEKNMSVLDFLKKYQLALLLLIVVVVMGIAKPNMFFTGGFFINVFLTIAIYGVMICGTIFVLIKGEIDLSIASIAAMSGTILVKHIMDNGNTAESVVWGVVIAIVICTLIGLLNGVLAEFIGIPSMIITIATKNIISAANQLYIQNKTLTLNSPVEFTNIGGGKIFGIPMPIIIFLVFVVIAYIILEHTVFGRKVYSVGGNSKASRFMGINSKSIGIICFALSGFTAGVAGVVLASFNQQAVYFAAANYEGYVLVALVIGGVSLSGGEGGIVNAIFGAILLGMINRSLILLGVDSVYHDIVRGTIIILAVALDVYTSGNRTRNVKKKRKLQN